MNLVQTTLIALGGAVVVGGAAFAGVKIYKNYSKKKTEEETLEKAKKEFSACADTFSGLYEPIYMMEKRSIKYRAGVIGDWVTRTENLADADNYKRIWISRLSGYDSWDQEKAFEVINELLSFISSAGICRDTADHITVDSTTYKKYSTFDGEMIESQNPARVKTPYWFIEDRILEKGIIEKM